MREERPLADRYDGGSLSAEGHIHGSQVGDDWQTGRGSDGCAIAQLGRQFGFGSMKTSVTMRADESDTVRGSLLGNETINLLT